LFQIIATSKSIRASLKDLGNESSFVFRLHGYNVIALRLPTDVVREISGQDLVAAGSVLSRLKTKLKIAPQAERWLAITSVDNPMLEQLDAFQALLAEELGYATGEMVIDSSVEVCATVPLNAREPFDPTAE
jgi:hypothetical protein